MRRSKGPWGSSGLDRAKLVKGEDDGVAIIHTSVMASEEPLLNEADEAASPVPQPASTLSRMASLVTLDMRSISLAVLTLQNAVLAISMRKAKTGDGPMFFNTTAVLMAEIVKLTVCLFLVWKDENFSTFRWSSSLRRTFLDNFRDTVVVCVPSAVYFIQNMLLYVAATNLDVATYQITYQMKILTTAGFAMLLLGRSFSKMKWAALLILVGGVITVQLSGVKETKVASEDQSRVVGFLAAVVATVCSGFAGIFFEKILKGSDISVWMRNVQLSIFSIPSGTITMMFSDGKAIMEKGFFYGYTPFVWWVIVLNALGGLLVALVIKYADNILKGYACSLAIILSSVFSYFFFGLEMSVQFLLGASMVMGSVYLYNVEGSGGAGSSRQGPPKGGGMQKV